MVLIDKPDKHEHTFHWYITIVALLVAIIGCASAYRARSDANKAQLHLCAWVFYEDGSALRNYNDVTRFKCMDEANK